MAHTSTPFIVLPTNPPNSTKNASTFAHFAPSFPLSIPPKSDHHSDVPAVTAAARVAHTNAHHLHSIPPAHKSTKTMILDHLLYLHAQARLTQVCAELGIAALDRDTQESNATCEQLCQALCYGSPTLPAPLKLKGTQDGSQARAWMARANGLEKVIGAMMGNAASAAPLPESVRFRIALGMLVDDIVAFRRVESTVSTPDQQPTPIISPLFDFLSQFARESSVSGLATPSIFHSHSWAPPPGFVGSTLTRNPSRSKELFNAGLGPSMSPRCARHLLQSCPRCTASLSHASSASRTSIGSGLSSTRVFLERDDLNSPSGTLESIPYFLQLSALVCSHLSSSQRQPRREEQIVRDSPLDDAVSFASTSSLSTTDSGTPHPASSAGDVPISEEDEQVSATANSSLKRRALLPFRFSRAGSSPYLHHTHQAGSKRSTNREGGEEEEEGVEEEKSVKPTREWYALLAGLITRALLEGYLLRGWRGTRVAEILFRLGLANEDGRVQPKKRKKEAEPQKKRDGKVVTQQQQLDAEGSAEPKFSSQNHVLPEDLPSMEDIGSALFGSGSAFQEYVVEMEKRYSEFTTVAESTPDLASHLDALVREYPLEPIQIAALRFCEAVSLWCQSPELEEYKARTGQGTTASSSLFSSSFSVPNAPLQHPSNDYTPSSSIQSQSPTLQSTSGEQRARLSPSISIASLVHPPSSINAASDSVSFFTLSSSSPCDRSRKAIVPASLQRFFATPAPEGEAPPSSWDETASADVGLAVTKTRIGGSRLAWAGFTLGAKRPREKEGVGEGWESERGTKKTLRRGGFNR